jgi:hypothetical protein
MKRYNMALIKKYTQLSGRQLERRCWNEAEFRQESDGQTVSLYDV